MDLSNYNFNHGDLIIQEGIKKEHSIVVVSHKMTQNNKWKCYYKHNTCVFTDTLENGFRLMTPEEKAEYIVDNGKIVCLVGSTKFKEEFELYTSTFSKRGDIVLSVAQFSHYDNINLTEEEKLVFDKLHFKKIELADFVFVINPNGYIGESTKREIEYATSLKKQIFYKEDIN